VRAVVQRVSRGEVRVGGSVVASIGHGLVVLVGVAFGDTEADADALGAKIAHLRMFTDDTGRMNRSIVEAGGSVIVISQFTLLADLRKGRRPSFTGAANPESAAPLVESVAAALSAVGVRVQTGRFGAHMEVDLINDGPVTLIVEVVDGTVH